MPSLTMRGTRGYLLLEVTVGSAILAVLAAGIITQLVRARSLNVAATRDVTASQLVLERIEQIRAAAAANGVAGLSATNPEDPFGTTPSTQVSIPPGYRRTTSVANDCEEPFLIQGTEVALACRTVTVEVSYTINVGSEYVPLTTRTTQASVRVYSAP